MVLLRLCVSETLCDNYIMCPLKPANSLWVRRKPTPGLHMDFVSNVRHVQWRILQSYNEDSMFIQVREFFFDKSRFHDEIHGFFSSAISVFTIFLWDLRIFVSLHIPFLEPLHSARDRHPYQRTCSHSPTYDLRSCCYIFFISVSIEIILWIKKTFTEKHSTKVDY